MNNEEILKKINNKKLVQALKNLEEITQNKIAKIQQEKCVLEQKIKKLEAQNQRYQLTQNSIKNDLEKIKNIIRRK